MSMRGLKEIILEMPPKLALSDDEIQGIVDRVHEHNKKLESGEIPLPRQATGASPARREQLIAYQVTLFAYTEKAKFRSAERLKA